MNGQVNLEGNRTASSTTGYTNEMKLYRLRKAIKYTGCPQKTGHCLISCNVKAIKAIAMK
jgi:hypothetical protein